MNKHNWKTCRFCHDTQRQLADVLPDDLSEIKKELSQGKIQLFDVSGPGYAGKVMTRVEQQPNGEKVLVLMAGAGKGYAPAIEHIKRIAKKNGIKYIRIHADKPGTEMLACNCGFRCTERGNGEAVLTCEV